MSYQTQEARILLAIDAIANAKSNGKKLAKRRAAKTFQIPYATLNDRMNNRPTRSRHEPNKHKLDSLEEKIVI